MEYKKVSIITPCYNGEMYLDRFFRSILNQTYKNIELIFVNDGSTDKTEEIVEKYRPVFVQNDIDLIYIKQENAGQAAAMNKGLAIFTGDYLVWTDSDDVILPENISKKVDFLNSNPEYGFAICRGQAVMEGNLDVSIENIFREPPQGEDHFFEDLLTEKNVLFYPGLYIARREAVLKALPERKINESRVGQNWQMLLPLAKNEKCGYMKDYLFLYVIRENSHSRSQKTVKEKLEKYEQHQKLLEELINSMNLQDKERYLEIVHAQCLRKQFDELYRMKERKLITNKYEEMSQKGYATNRDRLILYAALCPVIDMLYSLYKKKKIREKNRH